MDMTTALLLGVLYSSIGLGHIIYGRKQRKGVALVSGIALCLFPYFVQNVYLFNLMGIVLTLLPFIVRV